MKIKFRVNDSVVEIHPPSDDEEMCSKLSEDNAYTNQFIRDLAETEQITVVHPIAQITRFITETEEEFVYLESPSSDEETGIDTSSNPPPVEASTNQSTPTLDNTENSAPNNQKSDAWDDKQSKFILDQYHKYMTQIGPMKKLKNKKTMWEEISKNLLVQLNIHKTPTQVENRYKTVMRRKKDAVENNSKSGNSRQSIEYEEEMNKISALDDSIEPEVIRSSKTVKVLKKPHVDDDSDESCEISRKQKVTRHPKKQRTSNIVQTLKELQRDKEAAKQQRHKEKLELIRTLLGKDD